MVAMLKINKKKNVLFTDFILPVYSFKMCFFTCHFTISVFSKLKKKQILFKINFKKVGNALLYLKSLYTKINSEQRQFVRRYY